jgi:hypothetical protein
LIAREQPAAIEYVDDLLGVGFRLETQHEMGWDWRARDIGQPDLLCEL